VFAHVDPQQALLEEDTVTCHGPIPSLSGEGVAAHPVSSTPPLASSPHAEASAAPHMNPGIREASPQDLVSRSPMVGALMNHGVASSSTTTSTAPSTSLRPTTQLQRGITKPKIYSDVCWCRRTVHC
jgi:hypothetical protein